MKLSYEQEERIRERVLHELTLCYICDKEGLISKVKESTKLSTTAIMQIIQEEIDKGIIYNHDATHVAKVKWP